MENEGTNLIFSVLHVIGLFVLAYFIASLLNHKFFFFRRDRFVVLWYTFVVLARLTLDLPFVFVSFRGTLENSQSGFVIPAKEYGKADKRWMRSDESIVALEAGTVVVEVILGILVVRGILYKTVYRHFVQTCASTLQVYRVWLIFGPEIMSGFKNIDFSNPAIVGLYIFIYNGIWTLAPALIFYETYLDASTGVMRYVTPYRRQSTLRTSKRSFSTFRNRDSWLWHS